MHILVFRLESSMACWTRRKINFALMLLMAGMWSGCAVSPAPRDGTTAQTKKPAIVFMTDFGTANDAVAICRAVIIGIAPDVRIMDITHQVTPFSIEEASRFLAAVSPYYPAGT